MKKQILLFTAAILVCMSANAQQWIGNNNATDPISRSGNVTIGSTTGNYLTLNTESYHGGGQGGYGLGRALRLVTQHPNTTLTLGSKAQNQFYIGRAGSGDNLMNLTLDVITKINGGLTVGQMTSNTSQMLTVHGSATVKNFTANGNATVQNFTANGNATIKGFSFTHEGADFSLGKNDGRSVGNDASQLALVHGVNDELYINYGGSFEGGIIAQSKVGIGTGNIPAGYNLAVNGGIIGTKVKVALHNSNDWADYVFDKSYKLMPLSEVESFIKENKHLPNVPSADEVVESGIDVAKMDAKLLEKIEELTLYVIDQQKLIEKQQEQINLLIFNLSSNK